MPEAGTELQGMGTPGEPPRLLWLPREDRVFRVLSGPAAVRILNGLVSGRIPAAEAMHGTPGELVFGDGSYSTILTPKGRMIADLRIFALPSPKEGLERFLLDLPAATEPELRDYFRKVLPPRMARIEEPVPALQMLTLVGEGGHEWLSREVGGLRVESAELRALEEGHWFAPSLPTGGSGGIPAPFCILTRNYGAPAWDLVAAPQLLEALAGRLAAAGPGPAEMEALEVLRVEAGRPRWGAELDPGVLPPEAGIVDRAVDSRKGCYTGQEVMVRIRDRGQVNRHLRLLRLGGIEPPEPGTLLHREGREVGRITSAVRSRRFGETLALGYVRREVDPGSEVRIGGDDGPKASVHALDALPASGVSAGSA